MGTNKYDISAHSHKHTQIPPRPTIVTSKKLLLQQIIVFHIYIYIYIYFIVQLDFTPSLLNAYRHQKSAKQNIAEVYLELLQHLR